MTSRTDHQENISDEKAERIRTNFSSMNYHELERILTNIPVRETNDETNSKCEIKEIESQLISRIKHLKLPINEINEKIKLDSKYEKLLQSLVIGFESDLISEEDLYDLINILIISENKV